MLRFFIGIVLFLNTLNATHMTPNKVYSKLMLITEEIHFLLKYYNIPHDHEGIIKRSKISTKMKPRNTWQVTYEIMIKINSVRSNYDLPRIEPVNITPTLNLKSDLVYEQTQRILTEIHIFKNQLSIKSPIFKEKKYTDKTSLDVYNSLTHISSSFDELNLGVVTPSFVFGENMRIYDDLTVILQRLKIKDKTIPKAKNNNIKVTDIFDDTMKILDKIKQLQISVGIDFVNFSEFKKGDESTSEVYTITQMVIAELQTIKAYLNIDSITPAAVKYNTKTPSEVGQIVSWNLRKLQLIDSLNEVK